MEDLIPADIYRNVKRGWAFNQSDLGHSFRSNIAVLIM